MSELRVVEEFRGELLASGHPQRARRLRRWFVVPAVGLGLLGAGATLAATGAIEMGNPVRTPRGAAIAPHRYAAPTVRGTARIGALTAPDPAGGPPWGVRLFRNRAGLACMQLGRVVNGHVGVLGTDGKLHELPLRSDTASCMRAPRRNRHAPFAVLVQSAVPAVAPPVFPGVLCGGVQPTMRPSRPPRTIAPCDLNRNRLIAWGMVAPGVRALLDVRSGRRVAIPPDRAFVVVRRSRTPRPPRFVAVMADGRQSDAFSLGGAQPRHQARADRAAIARSATAVTPRSGGAATTFTVHWRVPAVPAARRESWSYHISGRGGERCDLPLDAFVAEPAAKRRRRIVRRIGPPTPPPQRWCPGRYRGEIRLDDRIVVGRFTFTVR